MKVINYLLGGFFHIIEADILDVIFIRLWLRVLVLDNARQFNVPFIINLKGNRFFIMK